MSNELEMARLRKQERRARRAFAMATWVAAIMCVMAAWGWLVVWLSR